MESDGVRLLEAPIENPGSIVVVEHYHPPLLRALNLIRGDMDYSVGDSEFLKMAVFSVNATVGPV